MKIKAADGHNEEAAQEAAQEDADGDVRDAAGPLDAVAGGVPLMMPGISRFNASYATALLVEMPASFDIEGDVGMVGRICRPPNRAAPQYGTGRQSRAL